MVRVNLVAAFCFAALTAPSASAQCNDIDGDGFFYEVGCGSEQDCNDADPWTFPGTVELCDGFDNDCDGLLDNDPDCDGSCEYPGSMDKIATDASGDLAITWNGSEYGIVWIAPSFPAGLWFTAIDATGNTVVESRLVPTTTFIGSGDIAITWNGSEYGVAYRRSSPLRTMFVRLDRFGALLSESQVSTDPSSGSQRDHVVVWNGEEYGIAWNDSRNGPAYWSIYFARVDRAGTPIGTEVRLTDSPNNALYPSLVWNGESYGLAWTDTRLQPPTFASWTVYFARFDRDGARIGDEIHLVQAAGEAWVPSLAWTGTEYGIAWQDLRDAGEYIYEVYFARIDTEGQKIGADTRITFASLPTLYPSTEPRLIWTGQEYGLAWRSANDPHYIRLSAAGVAIGEQLQLADGWGSLTWNGEDYGLVNIEDHTHYLHLIGCNCPDPDADGINECLGDNCPSSFNPDQADVDSDSAGDACDNCIADVNPDQADTDGDSIGNTCDNCPEYPNVGQSDADGDARGDLCDNCRDVPNSLQENVDGDGYGDSCDNCVFEANPAQTNMDGDAEGDHCDLDDGMIYIRFAGPDLVEWHEESGFNKWNLYKGDLEVLRTSGVYTQDPASVPLARRDCRLNSPSAADNDPVLPGEVAMFLSTGLSGNSEGDLGADSAGTPRPSHHPCP